MSSAYWSILMTLIIRKCVVINSTRLWVQAEQLMVEKIFLEIRSCIISWTPGDKRDALRPSRPRQRMFVQREMALRVDTRRAAGVRRVINYDDADVLLSDTIIMSAQHRPCDSTYVGRHLTCVAPVKWHPMLPNCPDRWSAALIRG